MKKYALIMSLVLVAASATWANLLSNPGFESGSTDWVLAGRVATEPWAARSGTNGAVFQGWNWSPDNHGNLSQKAPVTATGEYTFSIWICAEANYAVQTNTLSLQWLDDADGVLQAATVKEQSIPRDGYWHRIYITGSCASSDLAYVTVSLEGAWGNMPSDPRSCLLDDAVLVTGALVKTGYQFSNGGFENGDGWAGSQWTANTNVSIFRADWAARSGSYGVALAGWDDYIGPFAISQPVYPENTGTFTFSFWGRAEADFNMTNGEIRLEYYDETLTNQIQVATVQEFIMPALSGETWYEYVVTGVCADVSLYEVRPSISFQWDSPGSGDQAGRIDDCLMRYGDDLADPLDMDWAYFSAEGYNPATELVPNTNVGTFLQFNYA
ncbi:MAG: hypothetical protein EOM20_20715, partial [Spartobacteria bacterium]|nr:hypothetical protein [Spartobacteria bacterium]